MGKCYIFVNHTKQEYLRPLGGGKLLELVDGLDPFAYHHLKRGRWRGDHVDLVDDWERNKEYKRVISTYKCVNAEVWKELEATYDFCADYLEDWKRLTLLLGWKSLITGRASDIKVVEVDLATKTSESRPLFPENQVFTAEDFYKYFPAFEGLISLKRVKRVAQRAKVVLKE